ncbi:MAG TPA: cation diffusion facilitator family transporter [Fibrobacteria bacterium]|nr:cation diffusion facilitator family transporter [Fibrobacteria bacterium]
MGSHHHHDIHHMGHMPDRPSPSPALAKASIANLGWSAAQAAAGLALGSTALLSDSVHNLGDATGLVLAWIAANLSRRRATHIRTWGLHRTGQLAGFANAVLVLVGAAAVGIGAIWRLAHPIAVDGLQVSLWALGGIAVNVLSAWWIGSRNVGINARGAYLHLVSDAAISAAVVVGGLAVHFSGLAWIDPLLALGISLWLLAHTWPFFRETLDTILDAVPLRHDPSRIQSDLAGIEGVESLHDLHIWPLGDSRTALSVHLVHRDQTDPTEILRKALDKLHHEHPDIHATIQVEPSGTETWHGHEVCPGRE